MEIEVTAIHLSRQAYDRAITADPRWMEINFPRLDTTWSLSGVRCEGSGRDIANLTTLSETPE
tara:strand:+ start:420 stop:608 length:189 start_codon:yes stop_codon:yes gene_type:complete